jgi:hypothetical protein
MNEQSRVPPADPTLRADWFVEKLGASQQKVMSLTVENLALKKQVEKAEAMSERLEELVIDVVADLAEGLPRKQIELRIRRVIKELDDESGR